VSKFSNLLTMLILLKSRGKMKGKELAEILEVDERMIRKYKDDLELAGIYIDSVPGPNGGYELQGYDYLLKLDIEEEEFFTILQIKEQLNNINFVYKKEFESLFNKLNIIYKNKFKDNEIVNFMIKDVKAIDGEDEKKKCTDVHSCIATRRKMDIKYFSLSTGESNRVIHPYAILTYKGSYYVIAYCEKRNRILDFKLCRIREYKVKEDRFIMDKDFDLKEYMKNSIGLYKDENIKLKLRIEKPLSYIVSEKLWVENQKISWNEDESIIFEAEMQGKTEIISWILSMGSKVTIIEPEELKNEIKEEVMKMQAIY